MRGIRYPSPWQGLESIGLSSLAFLHGVQSPAHRFTIVNLNQFNHTIYAALRNLNFRILTTSRSRQQIDRTLASRVTSRTIRLSAARPATLGRSKVARFSAIVITVNGCMRRDVVAALGLGRTKIGGMITGTSSRVRNGLLSQIKTSRIIFPRRRVKYRLTQSLASPNVLSHFRVSPSRDVTRVVIPGTFSRGAVVSLSLQGHCRLALLTIDRSGRPSGFRVGPDPIAHLGTKNLVIIVNDGRKLRQLPIWSMNERGSMRVGVQVVNLVDNASMSNVSTTLIRMRNRNCNMSTALVSKLACDCSPALGTRVLSLYTKRPIALTSLTSLSSTITRRFTRTTRRLVTQSNPTRLVTSRKRAIFRQPINGSTFSTRPTALTCDVRLKHKTALTRQLNLPATDGFQRTSVSTKNRNTPLIPVVSITLLDRPRRIHYVRGVNNVTGMTCLPP